MDRNIQKNQERKGPPKEFFKKYDTNKDGKLDKEERSKISPKDKKKFAPPLRGPKGPHLPKKRLKKITRREICGFFI